MESEEGGARERSPRSQSCNISNWKQYRCFAIGVGYNGEGYHGFQIQPNGTRTVEKDIQTALIEAGLIDARMIQEDGRMQLFWSRAARTDRGVHACMNVVACRLDSSLIKSEGSDLDQDFFCDQLNRFLPQSIRCMFINRVTMRFDARVYCDRRQYEYYFPKRIGSMALDLHKLEAEVKKFEGTHNFHNFTRGIGPKDKSAVRHIVSISVENVTDEFGCVKIYGQSFLLNQIRKMVGLGLEAALGLAPEEAIFTALTSNSVVHIHMAPAEGLLLDRLNFQAYDLHKCGDYLVTTPFSWLIADEESEGNPKVMNRIFQFKQDLVSSCLLPKLQVNMDDWIKLAVAKNPWGQRNSA